jgi:hypothetical protein
MEIFPVALANLNLRVEEFYVFFNKRKDSKNTAHSTGL